MERQTTIKNKITIKGKGLHTGKLVEVNILPSTTDSGIVFKRGDVGEEAIVKALAEAVTETSRGTTIENKGAKVATIEHLMAALYSQQIDNVLIEIDGEEVPILDGSSKYWLQAIENSGVQELDKAREYYCLKEIVTYVDEENDIELVALPYDGFKVDLNIDFSPRIIGSQQSKLKDLSEFKEGFSNCRTFVFLDEIEQLLKLNLIKGGDLDNALIFVDKVLEKDQLNHLANLFGKNPDEIKVEKGLLNNVKQNFDNEPARHKLLDFIGDIALVGKPLKARFFVRRPGHKVNNILARKIKTIMEENKGIPVYDPNKEPVYDIKAIKNL